MPPKRTTVGAGAAASRRKVADVRSRTGKGRKAAAAKENSSDEDNVVSDDDDEKENKDSSSDLSFQHRPKQPETAFDRLFSNGPKAAAATLTKASKSTGYLPPGQNINIRNVFVDSLSSSGGNAAPDSSSASSYSASSPSLSGTAGGGLFASPCLKAEEDVERMRKAKEAKNKKKQAAARKVVATRKTATAVGKLAPVTTDRIFSDDTLEYYHKFVEEKSGGGREDEEPKGPVKSVSSSNLAKTDPEAGTGLFSSVLEEQGARSVGDTEVVVVDEEDGDKSEIVSRLGVPAPSGNISIASIASVTDEDCGPIPKSANMVTSTPLPSLLGGKVAVRRGPSAQAFALSGLAEEDEEDHASANRAESSELTAQEGHQRMSGLDVEQGSPEREEDEEQASRDVLFSSVVVVENEEEEARRRSRRNKPRKTVRIGAFEEISDGLKSLELHDQDRDGAGGVEQGQPHVVLPKGGKGWRRTLHFAMAPQQMIPGRASVAAIAVSRASAIHPALQPPSRKTMAVFEREDEGDDSVFSVVSSTSAVAVPGSAIKRGRKSRNFDHSVLTPLPRRSRPSVVFSVADTTATEADSVVLEDREDEGKALTAEEKVLTRCTTREVLDFGSLLPAEILAEAKKVGEGSYGEVFLLPSSYLKGNDSRGVDRPPVLKVVPVDGQALVNQVAQTKLEDMLAEVTVSAELSEISRSGRAPNFVQVLACHLVRGAYPSGLLALWDDFDRERGSENDRPDEALLPDPRQAFVCLVYSNGGSDLEGAELSGAARGLSVFCQVAHVLAVAEELLEFEHRDLHWGNLLVGDTDEKSLVYSVSGVDYEVRTEKIKVTVIDFTLSRCKVREGGGGEIFTDLSQDEDLFTAEGDYQFDIYRMMREHVGDDWRGFHPKTNVFWLHYLADKLVSEVPYKLTKSKLHRQSMSRLRSVRDSIMEFDSAAEWVRQEGKKKLDGTS